ncbi:hypothetical protein, conserved [Eimeria praecox]|uniref:Uncharacterized protein n=1 Tax=Eimeria praecox TaxID=51316 RepID=U6H422_9EIME|nr:hypothetical protein, conserved [Eimeria praecox]
MVSLVRMAGMTVKICSSVVSGLSAMRSINGVPEEVLQQQLGVLDAVFSEHSKYIRADNLHKSFIHYCQRHTKQQALLPSESETSAPTLLPSLKKLLQGISTAVNNAGGLLQFAGGEKPHDLLLPNPQEPWKPDDPNTQIQADEGAPQESHSSSEYAGLTPSLEVHTAAPSIGPAPPQVAAWRVGTQPVESVKPTLPRHPQYAWNTKQEELENPPYLLASRMLGTSISWMHTPAHGDTGTHPPVSRKTQQPGGTMTSLPTPFHGDDVGVTSLQRSLLEHSLYAVSRRPEQQSPGASAEASVGVESRRGFFRGGNVPDQALPAPWAPASTDSGQHMPTRVVTWAYGAGEQSIPQRPRPEQADGMLAELIRGGLRLEDIFPEDSDVSSPM